ncbi:hypothetical protein SAMN05444162_1949 [Paenibacillaceae bacterium GAS479]|nr:hypothetical protein SAMN05444162_1949 [Paenibacillaceae bacterium GAS479]
MYDEQLSAPVSWAAGSCFFVELYGAATYNELYPTAYLRMYEKGIGMLFYAWSKGEQPRLIPNSVILNPFFLSSKGIRHVLPNL